MLFNDYVVNLKSKSKQLEKLSRTIHIFKYIVELENKLLNEAFRLSYLRLIHSSNGSSFSNSNSLINYSESYISDLKESLISIDFVEFGIILSEFKSMENDCDNHMTKYIFDEMISSYKIIHKYNMLTNRDNIFNNYEECMLAIKNIINIYDKFIYISDYMDNVNMILCKGINQECLEIQLLNSDFDKDTYNKVIDPIYDIYNKLCEIADIKEELVIARIETGSFFAKFSGNLHILKLIIKILSSVHDITIRNFTREGKKKNLVESIDLFEKQVNIMKELKSMGIDVDENHEIAKETSLLLMKKSNILLSSSPDIKINDKVLSKSKELKKLLDNEDLKLISIEDDSNLIKILSSVHDITILNFTR